MQDRDGETGARPAARDPYDLLELPDDELDAYILARLSMLGVDLSVLPEDDPDAPADRARILESARDFLREAPAAIAALELDPQDGPPALYPAETVVWTRASDG